MSKTHAALIVIVSIVIALIVPSSCDFIAFYDASQALLSGGNPYDVASYYSPISVAVLYMPLAVLPYDLAMRVNMALMVAVYLFVVAHVFAGRLPLLIMATPFTILIARYGNLESLVMLGALLPATVGAWFVTLKPQLGLVAAAIMLYNGKHIKTGLAIVAMYAVSVALGMGSHTPVDAWWNISPFPYGLIIGLPLLYLAWRKRDALTAIGASVFVTPYMSFITFVAAVPLFRFSKRLAIIGASLSWAALILWVRP